LKAGGQSATVEHAGTEPQFGPGVGGGGVWHRPLTHCCVGPQQTLPHAVSNGPQQSERLRSLQAMPSAQHAEPHCWLAVQQRLPIHASVAPQHAPPQILAFAQQIPICGPLAMQLCVPPQQFPSPQLVVPAAQHVPLSELGQPS
jgi:hypothetical protein